MLTCAQMAYVDVCDCTQGLYGQSKRVCTESWMGEKSLPHLRLEPVSVICLAFEFDTLTIEQLPVPLWTNISIVNFKNWVLLITNFIQILNNFGFRLYPCVWNNVNNDCYEQIRNEFSEKNSEKNDQEQGVINVNISADLLLLVFVWYYGKLY